MTLEQLIENVRAARERWETTQVPDFDDEAEAEEAENDLEGDEIGLVDFILDHADEFIAFERLGFAATGLIEDASQ